MRGLLSTPLRKIVTINLVAILCAILLVGAFQYTISTKKGLLHAEEHLDHLSSIISLQIEELFEDAKKNLLFTASLPEFSTLPYTDQIDLSINGLPEHIDRGKRDILDELLAQSSFSVLFVLLPNGDHYISHPFSVQQNIRKGKYNLSEREYFKESTRTKKPALSESFLGADGIPAIAVDVPMLDGTDEIIAHLGGVFHLKQLTRALRNIRKNESSCSSFILDSGNNLIAHSDMDDISEETRTGFKDNATVGELRARPENKILPSHDPNHDRAHSLQTFHDPKTGHKHVAYVTSLVNGWHLVITEDWDTVLANYLPHLWPSIILTALIFLVVNGACLLYIRVIGKKLTVNEAYFREMFEQLPLPYQALDENGIVFDVNTSWLDTLGYQKKEITGKPFNDFLAPEEKELFKHKFEEFKRQRETHNAELTLLKKDGSPLLASYTGKVVFDDKGTFLQSHCIFHDITRQKQTEQEILQSKRQWERTFDAMSDIVTIQDLDMHIMLINRAGQETFGSAFEEIIGKHCYELFHGESEPCPECPLLVTRETFAPYTKIMQHEKLGKTFLVSAAPVLDEVGQLTHIAHVAKDITHQQKMEEQLFLSEKLATIAGLAAGVAHEINTPLSAILQSLQLIEMGLSPDEPDSREKAAECNVDLEAVQKYLKKNEIDFFVRGIRESALKAGHIIKSLLEFSRPHKGHFSSTCLEDLIENSLLLSLADYDLKKKYDIMNVKIVKEYAAEPVNIICVAMEIERVLLNIIKNSVQAMGDSDKEEKTCLTLRTSQKNGMAVIEIEDNGPGMTDEVKNHIFDPFYTTKEVELGTGLGLSVSHAIIVETHHGKINVKTQPGKGTTFIIELPQNRSSYENGEPAIS